MGQDKTIPKSISGFKKKSQTCFKHVYLKFTLVPLRTGREPEKPILLSSIVMDEDTNNEMKVKKNKIKIKV